MHHPELSLRRCAQINDLPYALVNARLQVNPENKCFKMLLSDQMFKLNT